METAGLGGVGLGPDNLTAYHVSAEVDLGSDVYLRLVREGSVIPSINNFPTVSAMSSVCASTRYGI